MIQQTADAAETPAVRGKFARSVCAFRRARPDSPTAAVHALIYAAIRTTAACAEAFVVAVRCARWARVPVPVDDSLAEEHALIPTAMRETAVHAEWSAPQDKPATEVVASVVVVVH